MFSCFTLSVRTSRFVRRSSREVAQLHQKDLEDDVYGSNREISPSLLNSRYRTDALNERSGY